MIVRFHTSAFSQTKWWEYALRFVLGGLITVAAGLIARKFGAVVGGLFLAFPAIFPAGATLIEKHERQRKEAKGLHGTCRARQAAGADAFGAAMGSLGLIAFAVFGWQLLPALNPALVIASAVVLWALVAFAIWWAWKRNLFHLLRRPAKARHRPSVAA
jgi:Protein of unknown function (DUF3147)